MHRNISEVDRHFDLEQTLLQVPLIILKIRLIKTFPQFPFLLVLFHYEWGESLNDLYKRSKSIERVSGYKYPKFTLISIFLFRRI